MTTRAKLGLLACLYLSQGLPYGFFTKAVPYMMSQRDLALGTISLTSLLYLPWALKFLWAPMVDRHGRSRRVWVLPLQGCMVAVTVALAWLDPAGPLLPILVGVAVINLLSATQDIPTDGLAVDLLTPPERGLGNGVQVGAYRVGMILGGGFVLLVIDLLGWRLSFLDMAAMMAFATLPILALREPPRTPREAPAVGPALWACLRREGMAPWLLVLVLYKGFDALVGPLPVALMQRAGLTAADVGLAFGVAGSAAALLGAVVAGLSVRRYGRRPTLLVFGALQAVAVGLYAIPAVTGATDLLTFTLVVSADQFFGTLATVALFTMMMDAARPEAAATDYTVQASVVVVATGVSATAGGAIADLVGVGPFFLVAAGLTLAGVAGVALLLRRPGLAPFRGIMDGC